MSKFLDWLLYDKPLFTKPIDTYSHSIDKSKWKKNWLGMTRVYESYDLQYNWCFIRILSHLEDDGEIEDLRNVLTIGFGGYYTKWLFPFSIIKPVLDYTSSYKRNEVEVPYSVYKEREYEISYNKEEGYIHFKWNYADNLLYNNFKHENYSKWITLFWGRFSCSCSKWELLNLDKTLYKDTTNMDYDTKHELEKHQQYIEFTFLDYDKEEITATGKLVRRVYSYGNNNKVTRWIMKFFKKPIDNVYLEMEFHKEIGPSKGSWKGGVTGQGCKLLPDELPEDGFVRYCTDPEVRGFRSTDLTNMTLIGFTYYKDVGLTDTLPIKQKIYSPFIFNLIDFQDRGIKVDNDYRQDHDLNLACYIDKISLQDVIKNHNIVTDKLFYIENEKVIGSTLFQFWKRYYTGINKATITSNGVFKYYFTEKAVTYLKEVIPFKYATFIECKGE